MSNLTWESMKKAMDLAPKGKPSPKIQVTDLIQQGHGVFMKVPIYKAGVGHGFEVLLLHPIEAENLIESLPPEHSQDISAALELFNLRKDMEAPNNE